ncbi:putative lipoprotein YceB [Klebsiella michiganensis]|nr:putative lipoprotein YceB [Klebsiella michiganensis]
MKKMFIAAALIVSGLLSACNQLTQYSVSEQEINQALQKRNHFAKDIVMRSAINEGQKARYLESKNVSIYESELQKKHPF